jgi:hypothetical protein
MFATLITAVLAFFISAVLSAGNPFPPFEVTHVWIREAETDNTTLLFETRASNAYTNATEWCQSSWQTGEQYLDDSSLPS